MPRILLAALLIPLPASHAADWPAWRGPTGQGFCDEKGIPLKWSARDNVRWRIKLDHQGNSTPVVWKDRLFLTQANKGGSVRSLLCFARADGEKLWQKDVAFAGKEQNWSQDWYANASPVTDGERVVACFGSAGLFCYGMDGKELWKRTDLGEWQHQFGNGASPVLHGGLVIQWCGPNERKGRNFLLAVDKKTGKTVWEQEEKEGSWATPVIAKAGGQEQMLLGAGEWLKGYDPASGKELWRCGGLQSYVYASALVEGDCAVGMSGYNKAAIAVKLGGTGDITKDRLWRHERNVQRVGSGMLIGGHVYMIDEDGSARCYDVKTGEDKWKGEKRRAGRTWGSLVRAEGRLYILMGNGETRVYAADPKHELLAVNKLSDGEEANSSLAISDGDVFIRTFRHLWCIRAKK
ncbi:MAG: PQQ-binding-like beta-propeller repeat protein [Gemmataceae bacterium]|nr:PQQ-binding-like beta-propeller repeat protein [Gemmataceae bacterium]